MWWQDCLTLREMEYLRNGFRWIDAQRAVSLTDFSSDNQKMSKSLNSVCSIYEDHRGLVDLKINWDLRAVVCACRLLWLNWKVPEQTADGSGRALVPPRSPERQHAGRSATTIAETRGDASAPSHRASAPPFDSASPGLTIPGARASASLSSDGSAASARRGAGEYTPTVVY